MVGDPANINWLTGYDAWSFYTPQVMVVGLELEPTWLGREMDAGAAKFTTYSISTPTTLDVVLESYRGSPYTCNGGVTMCRNSSTGSASECTVADLTVYDRWEVCQLARDELPEGEVYVSHNGIRATIAVAWTPIAARDDGGQMSILNPQCASMGIANTKDCILLEIIP